MKKPTVTGVIAAAAFLFTAGSQPAGAQVGGQLAAKNACTACHSTDKKLIGPSFREIAAKYKGQDGTAAMLADKVKKGSTGVWGQVPMPSNGHVPDDDIKAIVEWILAN